MYSILEGDANTNNMADLLVKQTAKAACPVIPYLIFRKLWRIVCWENGIFVIKDIIEWSWWNLRTEYFSICQQDWLPSKCFTEWKIIHIAQDFIFSPEDVLYVFGYGVVVAPALLCPGANQTRACGMKLAVIPLVFWCKQVVFLILDIFLPRYIKAGGFCVYAPFINNSFVFL